ncbi:hypothetical protein PSPO01_16007 [Paraphaeosphaeria sporulosa]
MHKVLKDYLITSIGGLLRVIGRIEQMDKSQHKPNSSTNWSHCHSCIPAFMISSLHHPSSASGNKTCCARKSNDSVVMGILVQASSRKRTVFHAVIHCKK